MAFYNLIGRHRHNDVVDAVSKLAKTACICFTASGLALSEYKHIAMYLNFLGPVVQN